MIKAIVNGAMGHMGAILINLIDASEKFQLAAAIDPAGNGDAVLKSLDDFTGEADVLIDFSHHTAAPALLKWAREHKVATIVATTGHDDAEKAQIRDAAADIPVFFSANMSMGIALLAELARKAAEVFPEADVEIIERHHNRKLDAPSGTALMLAEAVRSARNGAEFKTGRSGMAKRQPGEIGIHAVRLGNLPGTHEVILNTGTQQITLGHEVYDRALFAEGALKAAEFIVGKPAGAYDMKDIVAG